MLMALRVASLSGLESTSTLACWVAWAQGLQGRPVVCVSGRSPVCMAWRVTSMYGLAGHQYVWPGGSLLCTAWPLVYMAWRVTRYIAQCTSPEWALPGSPEHGPLFSFLFASAEGECQGDRWTDLSGAFLQRSRHWIPIRAKPLGARRRHAPRCSRTTKKPRCD